MAMAAPQSGATRDLDLKLNSDTGFRTAIGYLDTLIPALRREFGPTMPRSQSSPTQIPLTPPVRVEASEFSLDSFLLCEYGVVCDYGDTLQVGLNAPSDVTLTSGSGVSLGRYRSQLRNLEPSACWRSAWPASRSLAVGASAVS